MLSNESFMVQEDIQSTFYGILHTHPEIQITIILQSTGTLLAGDYIGQFKPGDLFVIGSDCPHVFRNDLGPTGHTEEYAHSISIFLGPQLLESSPLQIPETDDFFTWIGKTRSGLRTSADRLTSVKHDFLKIRNEEGLSKLSTLLQIINALNATEEMEVLLEEPLTRQVNEAQGKRLKEVFDYILQNFTNAISVEEISEVAAMTPQAFCRFFKRSTRKTFTAFLNELRVYRATQLLRDKDLSISDVSFRSGFNNLSHFNRQFLLSKNCTPSIYRKNRI